MTTQQRVSISDSTRTNGETPNPWWTNAVVYQIYPRSFQDSNGDGLGDIPGITSRLDYLQDLGVDVIWLSPVYRSPQDDNGYDIADYQDIDPMFGTLDDMDELIAQAHHRGIKIVMDLVVNHTSDEHAWFQASRDRNDEHADWYWWRDARPGTTPGEQGAEPNAWGSYFGGSAWEYDDKRGQYYFHQFSRKQPDLNWENPAVRNAVYAMMNWWMDRGIDGFRMDVIVLISKFMDAHGRLPGEAGSQLEDNPVGPEGFSDPSGFCCDGPRLEEFLTEMRREVFSKREGYLTVGEAPGLKAARIGDITNPENKELDMLFLFEQVGIDQGSSKWDVLPFEVGKLRTVMSNQQEAVRKAGWASLYFDNHDQPRVVSRWGDTSSEEMRSRSAKALGLLLHMHRGTPYIYQGEELGMTNAGFTRLDQYRDIESLDLYRQRVVEAKVQSSESMLHAMGVMSRDNARTPMQWDSTTYAGFTASYAPTEPWISVNPNHDVINAQRENKDDDSVLAFYRRLIELRHTNVLVAAGEWHLLDADDPHVYAFTRSLPGDEGSDRYGESHDNGELLVVVNLSSHSTRVPDMTARRLGVDRSSAEISSLGGIDSNRVLLSTYPAENTAASLLTGSLSPWEAFVYRLI
ncbi:alpha-glucosidase [Bifidobacterium aquikefiricola]|uniref:Alpha-glucosidase n=1 Tax=Bifidobacterium aquikefiricola TaxID=3059038 RepID=A0AB39U666_9BIFI